MPHAKNNSNTEEASVQSKQHVVGKSKPKEPNKKTAEHDDKENQGHEGREFEKIDKKSAKDCTTHWDDPDHMEVNQREFKKFQEANRKKDADKHGHDQDCISDEGGKKRGRGANASLSSPNKKQKKNDEPNGSAGDKTRVPKKGQKVQWHALPGYVDGEVVEVVYEEKTVDGKNVKGSKEDPRIVLKSEKSGKICVHKPEAVYF